MKKGKKLLVTASLVSTAVTMGGCRFLPWMNDNANVYGPPPDEYVTMAPVSGEEGEDTGTVPEGDEVFSPEENLIECLYGPPVNSDIIRNGEDE